MELDGVGDGNRTRVSCLEGRCSTIELHRRIRSRGRRRLRFFESPRYAACIAIVPVFPGCQQKKKEVIHAAGVDNFPAWWNSQDSNLGHYSSSHLSYCSILARLLHRA